VWESLPSHRSSHRRGSRLLECRCNRSERSRLDEKFDNKANQQVMTRFALVVPSIRMKKDSLGIHWLPSSGRLMWGRQETCLIRFLLVNRLQRFVLIKRGFENVVRRFVFKRWFLIVSRADFNLRADLKMSRETICLTTIFSWQSWKRLARRSVFKRWFLIVSRADLYLQRRFLIVSRADLYLRFKLDLLEIRRDDVRSLDKIPGGAWCFSSVHLCTQVYQLDTATVFFTVCHV